MSQGPETAAALRRSILAIALPSMLTNVATALFGLADMWVIGRLGDAAAQGGAKLLMTLLIVFNFLRSGTVALIASTVLTARMITGQSKTRLPSRTPVER